jgi:manganese transport protein
VMEGLLGMKFNIWIRRIVTRFINVIPATIALLLGFDPLSILAYSQVIVSLIIPLPMILLVLLTKKQNYHNNNLNYFCWNNINI